MESIMSLGKLTIGPRVLRTYDVNASAYIMAVESADNQTLEQPIKEAITEFVIGCKIRGIWDAIKSCCLLSGARTIAGATVPLKGNAPTLTSFVGDYNRETGLRRTSGSYVVNRNSDSDPQNNKHVAVYTTMVDYGSSDSNFRGILGASTVSGSTSFSVNNSGLVVRVNTATNIINGQLIIPNNLIGISILNSSQSQLLYNEKINIVDINTTTPPTGVGISLFGYAGVSTSATRVAFYSIGESLNLKLLNDCVNKFLSTVNIYFDSNYSMTDSDAINYVNNITALSNVKSMGYTYRKSINDFIVGCKNDNIWSALKSSCIMLGAQNLNGALYPLLGSAPTNRNFATSDYIANLGLKGATTSKGLLSNRNNNIDPQDSFHMSIFLTQIDSRTGEITYIGCGLNLNGASQLSTIGVRSRSTSRTSLPASPISFSFYGASRASSTIVSTRYNNTIRSDNLNSQTPYDANIGIFGQTITGDNNIYGNSDARLSFYSIGTSLDLTLLDNRVTTLINNLYSTRII
jgi:hypothetical protein